MQFHALALLYELKKGDRLALHKVVTSMARNSLKSPMAECLLVSPLDHWGITGDHLVAGGWLWWGREAGNWYLEKWLVLSGVSYNDIITQWYFTFGTDPICSPVIVIVTEVYLRTIQYLWSPTDGPFSWGYATQTLMSERDATVERTLMSYLVPWQQVMLVQGERWCTGDRRGMKRSQHGVLLCRYMLYLLPSQLFKNRWTIRNTSPVTSGWFLMIRWWSLRIFVAGNFWGQLPPSQERNGHVRGVDKSRAGFTRCPTQCCLNHDKRYVDRCFELF